MSQKHNVNVFETFEASRVHGTSHRIGHVAFYEIASGSHVFKLILNKIIRLLPKSNINDYTKFEDNQSKQSGLRAHTCFKNGWRSSWT